MVMLRIRFIFLSFLYSLCIYSRQVKAESYIWYNEPTKWSTNPSTINVHTDGNTDFWRRTHYGFERDNGHFYYRSMNAHQSFTIMVNVQGNYSVRYDQAGLMLRNDAYNWMKCGIEYFDDRYHASVVVTVNGWSDWSYVPLEKNPDPLRLRVKREGEAVHIEYAENEYDFFKKMRLAYLPLPQNTTSIMLGIMCCSPNDTTEGFDVIFDQLKIIEH